MYHVITHVVLKYAEKIIIVFFNIDTHENVISDDEEQIEKQ